MTLSAKALERAGIVQRRSQRHPDIHLVTTKRGTAWICGTCGATSKVFARIAQADQASDRHTCL